MADEYEVPVKVVDRRWWARGEDAPGGDTPASLKPSYVEELERKLADSEKQAQEYLGKYRQASQEFEVARARMRKELAKDAERSRRDVLASLPLTSTNFFIDTELVMGSTVSAEQNLPS